MLYHVIYAQPWHNDSRFSETRQSEDQSWKNLIQA